MPLLSDDLSSDASSLTGDNIVDAARSQLGSLGYKTYGFSNDVPAGVPKDHHFIADTMDSAGLGFGDKPSDRPSIGAWAAPQSNIPGWHPVSDGTVQAGDVLATPKPIAQDWYHGGGQQLGVATGNGTSVGIVDNDRIGENTFGLEDGHGPTVWRASQLAAATPQSGDADQTASSVGDIWDSILGRKGRNSGGEDIPPREPLSEEECAELHDADMCVCNALASPSARARCFASANERYAACRRGRPMIPLDTGR